MEYNLGPVKSTLFTCAVYVMYLTNTAPCSHRHCQMCNTPNTSKPSLCYPFVVITFLYPQPSATTFLTSSFRVSSFSEGLFSSWAKCFGDSHMRCTYQQHVPFLLLSSNPLYERMTVYPSTSWWTIRLFLLFGNYGLIICIEVFKKIGIFISLGGMVGFIISVSLTL